MSSSPDFTCGICLDTCTGPVVTRCGHLFCWDCLNEWLTNGYPECPVCKGLVRQDHPGDIIPIYGKGASPHPATSADGGDTTASASPPPAATTASDPSGASAQRESAPPRPAPGSTTAPPPPHRPQHHGPPPAAPRQEAPPRRGRFGRHSHMGLGMGSFFFFGGNVPLTVLLLMVYAVYTFVPWGELGPRVRNFYRRHISGDEQGANANRQAPRPAAAQHHNSNENPTANNNANANASGLVDGVPNGLLVSIFGIMMLFLVLQMLLI